MDLYKDILDEMDGRMDHIKTFYPFMTIHRSFENQKKDFQYDISSLCLAVLSFLIYEGRLKYRGLSLTDIVEFLTGFIKEAYGEYIDDSVAKEYTAIVLDKLQNEGKNYLFTHYSFLAKGVKQKIMKLVEMKLDDSGNTLHYFITKEGLDFFLKTKEFPEETQITINLLLFRKQIEKGSFDYALETVKRLNMEVQRKIEKKNWILELLMYGGKEGALAYREYHVSAMLQFQEENELFKDVNMLLSNVTKEYIEKINKKLITDKEIKAFTVLKQIEQGIHNAMEKHTKLLHEAARLTKEYDQILKLKTKATFSERFNFEGEFEKIVTQTNDPSNLKYMIEPLLTANRRKSFNVLKALAPQRLLTYQKKDNYQERDDLERIDRPSLDDLVKERVNKNFKTYAAHLLNMFTDIREFDLNTWSEALKKEYGETAVTNGDFISFMIELNRGKSAGSVIKRYDISKITVLPDEKLSYDMEVVIKEVIKDAQPDLPYRLFEVESVPDRDIDMGYGLKITDMIFRGIR